MADISKIVETACWQEFEAEGEEAFGKFKLKIQILDPFESIEFLAAVNAYRDIDTEKLDEALKKSDEFFSRVLDLVRDWDFTDHDQAIPCTMVEKKKHLLKLLKLKSKDGDGSILRKIMKCAQNPEMALKN